MFERLMEKVRPWLQAMEGMDDPQGEYLEMLENRVSRLEKEVAHLRGSETAGPSTPKPSGIG